jgi:hypothetical protein
MPQAELFRRLVRALWPKDRNRRHVGRADDAETCRAYLDVPCAELPIARLLRPQRYVTLEHDHGLRAKRGRLIGDPGRSNDRID